MDDSWRHRFQSEDEDEALARALILSLEEHQEDGRKQHGNDSEQPSHANRKENLTFQETPYSQKKKENKEPLYSQRKIFGERDKAQHQEMPYERSRASAIPLCLPNNWEWNPQTGKCTKKGDRRSSLYVIDEALEQLKKVKGPVCVVSIAGTYRQGKSFVLSEAFNQPGVFPLSHVMEAETMGIWLWIVPEKYKDSNGRECTVVLLDSEGIDAAASEGFDDHQIFTLTVLLASVLIYNSLGVPTRHNVEQFDFIAKLSQRIQIRSKSATVRGENDNALFNKTFPHFIWLLRDVTQSLPSDCKDIKDYFLKKIFKVQASSGNNQGSKQVAESILGLFPGFDAFQLPPPSYDPELMKNINENRSQINPLFLSGLEQFKSLIKTTLAPKHSFNDGEFVTGEGLAALVHLYVQAINSPDMIPNVQNAWKTFVEMKCSDAVKEAQKTYEATFASQLEGKLPCDNGELLNTHRMAIEKSECYFMAETVGISANTTEEYLNKLKEYTENGQKRWLEENNHLTKEECHRLLRSLKEQCLDPILRRLSGKDGASVSFAEITAGYSAIEQGFKSHSRGAKDVCAQVFYEFHPKLQMEMEDHMKILQQLKDYDKAVALEREERLIQEKEKQRIEKENERLEEEARIKKKDMELWKAKLEEDRKRLEEQFKADLEAQRDQMQNIMTAKMDELRKEKETIVDEHKRLQNEIEEIRKRENEWLKKEKERLDEERRNKENVEQLYYLEHLLDVDKLAQCLIKWDVFERLLDENFSIDLLRLWRKAGGYAKASALYRESLRQLRSSKASLQEVAKRTEMVAIFLIQAGQINDSCEILNGLLELEVTRLGGRTHMLADIYQLMSKAKSEVVKNYHFLTNKQLPQDREVVELCKKSLSYRKQLSGKDHELKKAMTYILIAHHLSIGAGLEPCNAEHTRRDSFKYINEAIDIFRRHGDKGHLAEAIMTKSFINPRERKFFKENEEMLNEALELSLKVYGKNSLLTLRLYLNTGILYEDNKDLQKAYDYFVKWYNTCQEVLGPSHPKTVRACETLQEEKFVRIRKQRGQ